MRRVLVTALLLGIAIPGGVFCYRAGAFRLAASGQPPVPAPATTDPPDAIGTPLYPPCALPPVVPAEPMTGAADPIVIPDCELTIIDRVEVPSQREGVLLVVGTEIEPGQLFPADQTVTVRAGGAARTYRRLKEGDTVKAGQLLACLDDQLARDDWASKQARVTSGRADLDAALRAADEAKNRYDTQVRLRYDGNATSDEDLRAAKLAWDKAAYDVVSRREAVTLAERELSQAETVLHMHELRSPIDGTIKAIAHKPGEAVKGLEPVFQIQNLSRLRAEGLVDVQHLARLQTGMPVVLESVASLGRRQTLTGPLREITTVAVCQGPTGLRAVAGGEDGTVTVWDLASGHTCRTLHHPAAVLALACTPDGQCLTGSADGTARLWALDGKGETPIRELCGQHPGGVTAVAFSPDGRSCATGGQDGALCLWDADTGILRYRFPPGHLGAVTALAFTPQARLVSAARDNSVRVWVLGGTGARLEETFDHRAGEVTQVGVRPDGRQVLFDQGNTLRLLALPGGASEGTLQQDSGSAEFRAFALFSPDARLVLSASLTDSAVQLWRVPGPGRRAHVIAHLDGLAPAVASCAAFSPDGSLVVVGTRERQVLVWPVPPADRERERAGQITLLERSIEASTRQVRIWAEFPNMDGRLLPGTTATLVVYPENHR